MQLLNPRSKKFVGKFLSPQQSLIPPAGDHSEQRGASSLVGALISQCQEKNIKVQCLIYSREMVKTCPLPVMKKLYDDHTGSAETRWCIMFWRSFHFKLQEIPPPKKQKKPNIHSDCLLRLFCKRKSISSSLGCSYTVSLFLKSFCSSSINSFPFHCRNNTRGPSQRQLCYWLLSFKQWWSSMSEGSIPAAYENDVRVCAVQWELPRPISCIHHHAPMVVRSPVNATVFTHSGSLSTRLY